MDGSPEQGQGSTMSAKYQVVDTLALQYLSAPNDAQGDTDPATRRGTVHHSLKHSGRLHSLQAIAGVRGQDLMALQREVLSRHPSASGEHL